MQEEHTKSDCPSMYRSYLLALLTLCLSPLCATDEDSSDPQNAQQTEIPNLHQDPPRGHEKAHTEPEKEMQSDLNQMKNEQSQAKVKEHDAEENILDHQETKTIEGDLNQQDLEKKPQNPQQKKTPLPSPCCKCEIFPDPNCKNHESDVESGYIEVTNGYAMEPMGCPNSAANRGTRQGLDIGFNLDAILWSAHEAGLGVGVIGVHNPPAPEKPPLGVVYYPKIKHVEPGFKAGVTVYFDHDEWTFFAEYTRLINNNPLTSFANDNLNDEILGFYVGEVLNAWGHTASSGTGQWNLHFNNIILEMGRNTLLSHRFAVKPYVGLQGSWQDQDLNVSYLYSITAILDNVVDMAQKFSGIGPRMGSEMEYFFTDELGLFGHYAFAMLWSNFQMTSLNQQRVAFSGEDFQYNNSFISQYRQVAPVMDMSLGVRYSHFFCENLFRIMLQAGWELQVWFGQNQFNNAFQNGSKGDLTLQGLTARGQIDF